MHIDIIEMEEKVVLDAKSISYKRTSNTFAFLVFELYDEPMTIMTFTLE